MTVERMYCATAASNRDVTLSARLSVARSAIVGVCEDPVAPAATVVLSLPTPVAATAHSAGLLAWVRRAKENIQPASSSHLIPKKAKKPHRTFKSRAKSIAAVHVATASSDTPSSQKRRRKLKGTPAKPAGAKSTAKALPKSAATVPLKPAPPQATAAQAAPQAGTRRVSMAEQRRLALKGFVPGISFQGHVDSGEQVRLAREELLLESQRELRRERARARTAIDPKVTAWGGGTPRGGAGEGTPRSSSISAVPRPPRVPRAVSPRTVRLASRPHSARETVSTVKPQRRGIRRPETARATMGGERTLVTPASSLADGGTLSDPHHHHRPRHSAHEVVHPAGRPRAKKSRAQLQRLLTQGPMQLDLDHHQRTDRTNNAQGQRATIDSIMRQTMQQRNTCSQLRTRREAKVRRLADLKVQMAEVDPQGGAAAAALARIEPLGMRRELLQYRLSELEQQMLEASEEGRVHHHIVLRTKAQHQRTLDGVEALQREKREMCEEERRIKEALAGAQQLFDHTNAEQSKLNAGYWAQHQFWQLEIERCQGFLSKTTAESAREKAFVVEQKKARERRLLMKREKVINTRRYQLAQDSAKTVRGGEGMSKEAKELKKLQQTTGLMRADDVIDAYFTLIAFKASMDANVEELSWKVQKLEQERSDLLAQRSADKINLAHPHADTTGPASEEKQSSASNATDAPAPLEQQETAPKTVELPRADSLESNTTGNSEEAAIGDDALDSDYGSATVNARSRSPLRDHMSKRDMKDLNSTSSARKKRARQRLENVVERAQVDLASQGDVVGQRMNNLRLWADSIQTQYDRICALVQPEREPEPEPELRAEPELEPKPEPELATETNAADIEAASSATDEDKLNSDDGRAQLHRSDHVIVDGSGGVTSMHAGVHVDVLSDAQKLERAELGVHTLNAIEQALLGILAELGNKGGAEIDAQLETGEVKFTEPVDYPTLLRKQQQDAAAAEEPEPEAEPEVKPEAEPEPEAEPQAVDGDAGPQDAGLEAGDQPTNPSGDAASPSSAPTATGSSASSFSTSSSSDEDVMPSANRRARSATLAESGAAQMLWQRKAQAVANNKRSARIKRSATLGFLALGKR